MADDAAHIASYIAPLAAEGKEIIMVAHSYGGTPVTEAVKGFAQSKGSGKGGVVGIVYITCVVPEVGKSAGETLANAGGLKPWAEVNVCFSPFILLSYFIVSLSFPLLNSFLFCIPLLRMSQHMKNY